MGEGVVVLRRQREGALWRGNSYVSQLWLLGATNVKCDKIAQSYTYTLEYKTGEM